MTESSEQYTTTVLLGGPADGMEIRVPARWCSKYSIRVYYAAMPRPFTTCDETPEQLSIIRMRRAHYVKDYGETVFRFYSIDPA
jgi:hypothetical protein